MTLPANIRINVMVLFPARVQGSGPITVGKANGIFTIGYSVAGYPTLNPVFDPTSKEVLVFDPTTGLFWNITVANLFASLSAGSVRTITAAGDVTVAPTDTYIRLNKTIAATSNVNLPTSASRSGVDLVIKDVKGNAASFNFAVKCSGTEDVDGITAGAGGYLGIMNFQSMTLRPRALGYDVIHSG